MNAAYIYLLQDGHDRGTNIYKIGKTVQCGDTRKLTRLLSYSHGTIQKYLWEVDPISVHNIENDIKVLFTNKFTLSRGKEWFEGNPIEMKRDIDNIIFSSYTATLPATQTDNSTDEQIISGGCVNNEPSSNITNDISHHNKLSNDGCNKNNFTCPRCGYETCYKQNLITHLRKKKTCNASLQNTSIEDVLKDLIKPKTEKRVKCRYCDHLYTNRNNRSRHEKTCALKAQRSSEISKITQIVRDLTDKVTSLLSQQATT